MSRIEFSTDPEKPQTHAMVVGIGTYPHCGPGAQLDAAKHIKNLTSPPASAHAVVDWLQANASVLRAPLASITLLADQVDGSAHQVTAPTFDNIRNNMRVWQSGARSEDCLLLYWCGHGFVTEHGRRILLCQDVGEDGMFWDRSVDNAADLTLARGSQAQTQLWLIDACQEAASKLKTFNPHGRTTLPDLTTTLLAQTTGKDIGVILSSDMFQTSEGNRHSPSYFCQALIEALNWRAYVERDGEGWSVRTNDIVGPVNDHLQERNLDQRCHSRGCIGHTILEPNQPPSIPAVMCCDPKTIQPRVTMSLNKVGQTVSALTPVASQQSPSEQDWSLDLQAGMFILSGTHDSHDRRESLLGISPHRRRGVLRWE